MPSDSTAETLTDPVRDQIIAEFGESALQQPSLSTDGAGQGVVNNGMFWELSTLIHRLRTRREGLGRSIAEVAELAELDPGVIERLESRQDVNPHFDAVWRYALALGVLPTIVLEDVEPEPTAAGLR